MKEERVLVKKKGIQEIKEFIEILSCIPAFEFFQVHT